MPQEKDKKTNNVDDKKDEVSEDIKSEDKSNEATDEVEVVKEEDVEEKLQEDEKKLEEAVENDELIEDKDNVVEEELIEENISEEIEGVEETLPEEEKIPDFRVGDTIRVSYKIIEGDKIRTQPYQGIVISKKGSDVSKTFTVRKIGADGVGVERIFPIHSPNIENIKVVKKGKVRRAKLFYLRGRVGRKATRIKERFDKKEN